jgi:hypothetical protein
VVLKSWFGLLLCAALPAVFVDAPLASSLPSIPSSTYPYYQTLKQYTFDSGANADAQGWTTHDLTAQQGTFWHVDDFAGLFPPNYYPPGQGAKSMWCGVRQGTLTDPWIKNAPGYGDGWTQILQSVAVNTIPDDIAMYLSASLRRDLAAWDYVDVEYRVGSGPWQLIERLGPLLPPTWVSYLWEAPVAEVPSTLQFRFVFVSDFNQSDENGANTNGAVMVDQLRIRNIEAIDVIPEESFEAAAVGNTSTPYWSASVPAGFGNYAGLVSGATVVQAGAPNSSYVWSFFNGSSQTYACGGYPSQAAVPKTSKPGSNRPTDYLWNEVRSPWIDLSVDQSAQTVDPNMTSLAFEFDVYADLPTASNRVMYTYRYRFKGGGVIQEWHMDQAYRSSNIPRWVHEDMFTLGDVAIPAGATHVQLGLIALDFAYASGFAGACHSQSPLFDNVIVHRMYEPRIVTNTNIDGAGSLLQAVTDANSASNFNCILFNIPGAGPHTIALDGPLPPITQPLWIDGFSQAGSAPNVGAFSYSTAQMKIALDGTPAGGDANGLDFAPGSYGVVRGLVIGGFLGVGIRSESTSLIVNGCYIGTNASGTTSVPNGIGIHAITNGINIGGPATTERMLISGNSGDGIRLETGSGPILNCHLGFDAQGFELANGGSDIHVLGGTAASIGSPAVLPCDPPDMNRVRIGISGIVIEPAASGVVITQVEIGNPYIDLGGDGPTPNDPLDADTGANGLQNFPVLSSADGTTIAGNMDGLANQMHRVEFFKMSQYSETQYIGFQNVTTDGSGHAPIFSRVIPFHPRR